METKKTILIADTSEEFRTILADALQAEEGLEVVGQTSDGQEAIQMVQDRSPDILVMDLVLGRMDGFDVLDAVKSKPVSTLILSGFARGCMADQVAARGESQRQKQNMDRFMVCQKTATPYSAAFRTQNRR